MRLGLQGQLWTGSNPTDQIGTKVHHGVPQGSVLFTRYMLPLGNIIQRHGIHFHGYTEDTQLSLPMKLKKQPPLA